jgi:hypothetical protein
MLRYQQRDQEVMGALVLDIRHRLLGDQEVFRGTLCRAEVEPREILKECLLRGAAAVVLFHTHPSGDPTPSDALQFLEADAKGRVFLLHGDTLAVDQILPSGKLASWRGPQGKEGSDAELSDAALSPDGGSWLLVYEV